MARAQAKAVAKKFGITPDKVTGRKLVRLYTRSRVLHLSANAKVQSIRKRVSATHKYRTLKLREKGQF